MARERLLKRLAVWQKGMKTSDDAYDLVDSVITDIELLLNSQRGNVLIDDTMGLSDLRSVFHGHSAPDVDELNKELMYQISEFEPRIAINSLTHDEEKSGIGRLCWRLSAITRSESNAQDLIAYITIDVNGRVSVSSAA